MTSDMKTMNLSLKGIQKILVQLKRIQKENFFFLPKKFRG